MGKVVLFSGGADSALLVARNKGCVALFFDYGQEVVEQEYKAASNICHARKCNLVVMRIPTIEKHGDVYHARNLVLVAHATSYAVKHSHSEVLIGCSYADSSDFPDCRGTFLNSLSLATSVAHGVEVKAPLLYKTRAEIIAELARYRLPKPWSCYANQQEQEGHDA